VATTIEPSADAGSQVDVFPETAPESFKANPSAKRASLWRSAWRWHFYSSLIVLPILLVLAVSGMFLLLKPTLERQFYRDRLYVDPTTEVVPFSEQQAAVVEKFPGSTVDSVIPPRDRERSTQFDITTENAKSLSVYVNPYSGKVLGTIDSNARLDNWMTRLHGELLQGRKGEWLMEIGAGWALVMAATGLYLWWPRFDKGGTFKKAFKPRWSEKGRKRVRDVHAIPGAIFSVFLVFLVVTGMPWSRFWGDRFSRFTYSIGDRDSSGANETSSDLQASSLRTDGFSVTWAGALNKVPLSDTIADKKKRPEPLDLELVAGIARKVGMQPGFGISLPADETGVYTLSNPWPTKAELEHTVNVDQYSGKVLQTYGYKQYGPINKTVTWGIDAHMGRQFGVPNAIVMGGVCLAVILASVTGPIMFWKRRPKGKLGTPRRPTDAGIPRGVLVIAAVLAVVYPLLGLSMITVAFFDRVVIRKIGPLRRAFGMP
jgi:uncharacterized iron-regulated membrane protein